MASQEDQFSEILNGRLMTFQLPLGHERKFEILRHRKKTVYCFWIVNYSKLFSFFNSICFSKPNIEALRQASMTKNNKSWFSNEICNYLNKILRFSRVPKRFERLVIVRKEIMLLYTIAIKLSMVWMYIRSLHEPLLRKIHKQLHIYHSFHTFCTFWVTVEANVFKDVGRSWKWCSS